MPGSNWNSTAPDGMEMFEKIAEKSGNKEKIDKDRDFKEFEKVINDKDSWWKEVLVTEVTKDQWKVLNFFDDGKLDEKVNNVDKDTNKSKDVKDAYKVLWAYKKGMTWSYEQVLEQVEWEKSLLKVKQKILNMIDNNNDWNDSLKETARTIIEDLFNECNSVEEFERRAWVRLSGVENLDNIWDFFRAIPEFMDRSFEKAISTTEETARNMLKLMKSAWYWIYELWKKWIELWVLTRNEFMDRCKEKWQNISDITKAVCERWKDQFKSFINYLKEKWEDISQTLLSAWEWAWWQWNKFADWCGWKREDIKDFTMALFELWVIKLSEFADRCKWIWEQWKQILVNVFEWNKNLVKDFMNWCTESRDSAKERFKDIFKSLLEKTIITIEDFTELCRGSWEKVKDVACVVLVYAQKALNLWVWILYTVLIEIPGMAIGIICGLLAKAWKEIYGAGKAFAEFLWDLAVAWWERAKWKGQKFAEYMKDFTNTLKWIAIEWKQAFDGFMKKMREWLKNAGISALDFMKATCVWAKWILKKGWDVTVNFFRVIWISIETGIQAIREAIGNAWDTIVQDVIAIYKGVWKGIKDALIYLGDKLKIWWEKICKAAIAVKDYFIAFIDVAKNAWVLVYENISKWLGWVRSDIKDFYKKAINRCWAKIDDIYKRCANSVAVVKKLVNEIFISVAGGVKKFVERIWKGAKAIASACEWLAKIWIWITAYIVEWLWDACKEIWAGIWTLAKALWEKCWVAARNICEWINLKVKDAKKVAVEVARAIADATSAAIDWVKTKINAWIDDIKYLYDKFDQWIRDIYNWLRSKAVSMLDAVHDILKALEDKWAAVIEEARKVLKSIARDAFI